MMSPDVEATLNDDPGTDTPEEKPTEPAPFVDDGEDLEPIIEGQEPPRASEEYTSARVPRHNSPVSGRLRTLAHCPCLAGIES